MHLVRFFLAFVFLACLSKCSSPDDVNSFKDEDIKYYNSKIDAARLNHEHWTSSPLLIIRKSEVGSRKSEVGSQKSEVGWLAGSRRI